MGLRELPAELNYRDKGVLQDLLVNHGQSDRQVSIYITSMGFPVGRDTISEWRRRFGIPIANEAYRFREKRRTAEPPKPIEDLTVRVKQYLAKRKEPINFEALCDYFCSCPKDMRETLAILVDQAVLVEASEMGIGLSDRLPEHHEPEAIDWHKYREVQVPIGVTGDSHIGSKYERLDVLNAGYDYWQSEGVTKVFHLGNIIDGERRGINEYDLYARGFEDQADNLVAKYPSRPGITTDFITGMCHEGWFIKQNKVNVGLRMEQSFRDAGREDVRFLGHLEHDIILKQDGGESKLRLLHPSGGSAYAESYKPQKIVESYQGGEKPQALFIGHYHKAGFYYPREVYTVQVGCTQDQSPWMRAHNIAAHVGFATVWLTQNELGLITGWKIEWKPFYDRKFYAFKW